MPRRGLMTSNKFHCLCYMALHTCKGCWEIKSDSIARGKGKGLENTLSLSRILKDESGWSDDER